MLYTMVAAMGTQRAAAQQRGSCALPSVLGEEIVRKYPAAHVVRAADLSEDDSKQFQQEHGSECPGLTTVNFYSDGKPTLAVVLLDAHGAKTQLIVAPEVQNGWELRSLEQDITGPAPVVGVSDRGTMTMSMARRR